MERNGIEAESSRRAQSVPKRLYGLLHTTAVAAARRLPIPSKVFGPPKGIVKDVAAWVEAYKSKHRLADEECWYSKVTDAAFVNYPEPSSLSPVENVFRDEPTGNVPETFTACLPRVRVISRAGWVVSPDDRVFEQSCSWGQRFFPSAIEYNTLRRLLNPVKLSGHYATIMGRAWRNFYHWNAECLTRLALLERLPDVPLLFSDKLTWWHRDSLAALGVEAHRIVELEDGCYEVDRLYFPSFAGVTGDIADWAWRDLRRRFWRGEEHAPKVGKRVYLSRGGAVHRQVVNEEEVVRALEREGFTALEPHRMTSAEKVAALCDAEVIVGVHGAGMTNVLFAPAGARVVEVLDPAHTVGVFYAMAASLGQDYWYLTGENEAARAGRAGRKGFENLTVPVDLLLRTLDAAASVRTRAQ
ncbi:MAG TPA: glycosyltransferase family 61 protein [Pyrinomonadaceae bacterium]